MRVLVTRPGAEAACLASRLRDRGHTAIVSPVLTIHDIEGPKISFDGVQGILATSANGIRALARRTARRDLPVFAVGPQTTTAAEEVGFIAARNAGGDSAA